MNKKANYNPKKKVFSSSYKVYFADTDAAGVMHHSRYINFLEASRIDFLDHIHYPYETLQNEKKGFSPIHIDIHYNHPLKFGDRFSVQTACIHIGKASVTFYSEIFCRNICCCKATQKLASLDEQLWKITRVPEKFIEALKNFEIQEI